jgi:hypothetical protein
MKRSIIISIMGLGVAVTLVHGQGSIAFNTYLANDETGIQVTYGVGWMGPPIGTPIGNTFTGELLYSATPIDEPASSIFSAFSPLTPGWIVGPVGTFAEVYPTGATVPNGYIVAPNLDIYANLGQTLYFEVAAFNGTSWGAGSSSWEGHSASFQATLVTGLTLPSPDQLDNLQPFQVFGPVPEPATLALGSLSLAALFLFRCKRS